MAGYLKKNLVITYGIVAAYWVAIIAFVIVLSQRFITGADMPPVWVGVAITFAAIPLSKLTDWTLKLK